MPLVVVADLTPTADAHDQVLAALGKIVPQVHAEDGCERYAVHMSRSQIVVIEQWRDKDSFKAHATGAALAELNSSLEGLLDGEVEVKVLTPLNFGDPLLGSLV